MFHHFSEHILKDFLEDTCCLLCPKSSRNRPPMINLPMRTSIVKETITAEKGRAKVAAQLAASDVGMHSSNFRVSACRVRWSWTSCISACTLQRSQRASLNSLMMTSIDFFSVSKRFFTRVMLFAAPRLLRATLIVQVDISVASSFVLKAANDGKDMFRNEGKCLAVSMKVETAA